MTIPTPEGLRRYPNSGGGYDAGDGYPEYCTCTSTCAYRCTGSCGCEACQLAFADFCDTAGLFSFDGLTVSEDEAERLYRQVNLDGATTE